MALRQTGTFVFFLAHTTTVPVVLNVMGRFYKAAQDRQQPYNPNATRR